MSSTPAAARPEEDADDFYSVGSRSDEPNDADVCLDEWLDAVSLASQGLTVGHSHVM